MTTGTAPLESGGRNLNPITSTDPISGKPINTTYKPNNDSTAAANNTDNSNLIIDLANPKIPPYEPYKPEASSDQSAMRLAMRLLARQYLSMSVQEREFSFSFSELTSQLSDLMVAAVSREYSLRSEEQQMQAYKEIANATVSVMEIAKGLQMEAEAKRTIEEKNPVKMQRVGELDTQIGDLDAQIAQIKANPAGPNGALNAQQQANIDGLNNQITPLAKEKLEIRASLDKEIRKEVLRMQPESKAFFDMVRSGINAGIGFETAKNIVLQGVAKSEQERTNAIKEIISRLQQLANSSMSASAQATSEVYSEDVSLSKATTGSIRG